ncbi:hypothetical protein SADO_00035 [Salinisphaera dokdonensis CL-ES53]|uniref:Uncharacterized protein n=1 Tax=Salinisphaera dokdonensis CL-ES53 TaxID=1304272 RepID=A0ABV2AWI5_9GAMM
MITELLAPFGLGFLGGWLRDVWREAIGNRRAHLLVQREQVEKLAESLLVFHSAFKAEHRALERTLQKLPGAQEPSRVIRDDEYAAVEVLVELYFDDPERDQLEKISQVLAQYDHELEDPLVQLALDNRSEYNEAAENFVALASDMHTEVYVFVDLLKARAQKLRAEMSGDSFGIVSVSKRYARKLTFWRRP